MYAFRDVGATNPWAAMMGGGAGAGGAGAGANPWAGGMPGLGDPAAMMQNPESMLQMLRV
jgi:hypothetical protein